MRNQPTIHFLNVKDGDCTAIEHYSGHLSVIDVCNAQRDTPEQRGIEALAEALAKFGEVAIRGNFNQKAHPVNPITYLKEHDVSSVFRFILSHPDMDHMDGIKAFFDEFSPANFWDTDNNEEKDFEGVPQYSEDDWKFYKQLRDGKPAVDPKRLAKYSGETGKYWNRSEDDSPGGDGLCILAPTRELVGEANDTGAFNDCSYVLLYRTGSHRIVFGGDSHDKTWDHILKHHKERVTDVDLLIAPHHGRKSGRSYEFLDTLRPALTFFGNARSEDLAYDAWRRRGLPFITNNQANCMVVDAAADAMKLYVTHEPFARTLNPYTFYSEEFRAYFCGSIQRQSSAAA